MEDIWNIFSESQTKTLSYTRKSSIDIRTCVECDSTDTMLHEGHTVCMKCGTDMGPVLEGDDTSIFHDTSKSGGTHRLCTNTNVLLQKSSLGTTIGPGSYRFRSMMRYHKYNSMPYKERSQWKIFKIIRTSCEKVNLPRIIIEESQRLYKKISEDCSARGNHRKGLIASCVFYACKYEGVPRTSKEVAKLFQIEVQDLTKAMKKFRHIIGSKKDHTSISTALDYIPRFCQQLGFNTKERHFIECAVAKSYIIGILPECTSTSLAATILYMTTVYFKKNDISKQTIANICKVSEVTILKCYRKLHQNIKDILPK